MKSRDEDWLKVCRSTGFENWYHGVGCDGSIGSGGVKALGRIVGKGGASFIEGRGSPLILLLAPTGMHK